MDSMNIDTTDVQPMPAVATVPGSSLQAAEQKFGRLAREPKAASATSTPHRGDGVPIVREADLANANPTKRLADAIAVVLRANGGPMGATEISKAVIAQGLWLKEKSKDLSKATWNALRGEINKGEVSRFVKAEEKGKYAIKG